MYGFTNAFIDFRIIDEVLLFLLQTVHDLTYTPSTKAHSINTGYSWQATSSSDKLLLEDLR